MGQNKLLLELEGETLVRRAVRAASDAGLGPVVVVLGHESERVRAAIEGLACVPIVNPAFATGKGTSLQAGIAYVSSGTDARAAVVMLADMPFVTAAMLAAVAARHRDSGAPLVVSRYAEVHAPPMLYARELFAELLALPGEACGKEMIRRHRSEAEIMTWPEAALADVDSPADYGRIRAGLGQVSAEIAAGAPTIKSTTLWPPARTTTTEET
jgi:molybdenum cofactor cytidylyltransferase